MEQSTVLVCKCLQVKGVTRNKSSNTVDINRFSNFDPLLIISCYELRFVVKTQNFCLMFLFKTPIKLNSFLAFTLFVDNFCWPLRGPLNPRRPADQDNPGLLHYIKDDLRTRYSSTLLPTEIMLLFCCWCTRQLKISVNCFHWNRFVFKVKFSVAVIFRDINCATRKYFISSQIMTETAAWRFRPSLTDLFSI